jgi:hypothetical protein
MAEGLRVAENKVITDLGIYITIPNCYYRLAQLLEICDDFLNVGHPILTLDYKIALDPSIIYILVMFWNLDSIMCERFSVWIPRIIP